MPVFCNRVGYIFDIVVEKVAMMFVIMRIQCVLVMYIYFLDIWNLMHPFLICVSCLYWFKC